MCSDAASDELIKLARRELSFGTAASAGASTNRSGEDTPGKLEAAALEVAEYMYDEAPEGGDTEELPAAPAEARAPRGAGILTGALMASLV